MVISWGRAAASAAAASLAACSFCFWARSVTSAVGWSSSGDLILLLHAASARQKKTAMMRIFFSVIPAATLPAKFKKLKGALEQIPIRDGQGKRPGRLKKLDT